MQRSDDICRVVRRLRVQASADLDERVHDAIGRAGQANFLPTSSGEPTLREVVAVLMKTKSTRYSLGAVLGVLLLGLAVLHQSTSSAWAIEDAIKALQHYTAVRMTGYTTAEGGPVPAEFWARADARGRRSQECLAKSDQFTAWTRENKTYVYDHARNTVLVEPAITMGLDPWLGPRLLTALSKMPDYKALEGDDPATGKKQILVTASIESATGPQSFLIEFDAGTKLPISMKHWLNLNRRGAPDFAFDSIVYFEELPDSAFHFEPPPGVLFENKPLTVPEANLAMLSNPQSGIPTHGLTREAACQTLLDHFWKAVISDDLKRIRQLCPITEKWPDRLLLEVMQEDEVVELLQVGSIEMEGQSQLGGLALVPSRVRCRDGRVREVKIVVQFRHTEQGASCVIHGNYGHTVEAGEVSP